MNTRNVAIARQVGASGEEVARAIADRMKFRYIDYQIIQHAAQDAGVSTDTVSEAEHTPSVMTRILESLAKSPSLPMAGWADPVPLTASPLFTSTDYRKFVEQVVLDLAEQGQCVIIGHAAQVILRGRLDTVRVLVTGSRDFRVRRIMAGMGVDEKAALKTVDRTDSERLDYYQRFYDTGWLTPCTYDLCLNTDHLNPEQAGELVAAAAALR